MNVYDLEPDDGILGILPFFHSSGFTAALWFPLVFGIRAVYHVNPLDAQTVGRLVREHALTFVVATPTFLQGYIRRCPAASRWARAPATGSTVVATGNGSSWGPCSPTST